MRALEPHTAGHVVRDGVEIGYAVFGDGDRTIVFPPIDPIVESRAWKAQVPYLARHARVITIDPRGNGRSGRPTDPTAYADRTLAADTIAVMDELGVGSAVLAGLCSGVWTALLVAAEHPDRVQGIVAVAPKVPLVTPPHPERAAVDFEADVVDPQGWAKDTRRHRERAYRDFVEFFFHELLPEPHSSKQWEDCVGWGLQTTAGVLNANHDAPLSVSSPADAYELLARVRCPALVIHGDEDHCQPAERAEILADTIGADRLTLVGAGHLPMAREPVVVNLAIRDFLDRVAPPPPGARRQQALVRGGPRVLYLSSPIGLGHARRDLAIVEELRRQRPGVQVDWLTQHPVTEFLRSRGEHVHPASAWLANESAHIEAEAGEHDLNAFQAIRQMDEILVANFMVFAELVEHDRYDLWVGDESWEVDHFLHENPRLKNSTFAWLTDFVGWLPMNDGREAELTADYNAEMLEHIARLPRVRDRSIFVGNPDDVVDESFGPGLPDLRSWTKEHYEFTGYVTGFDAAEIADRDALRAEFGFEPGEPVCVVAVGGSGVGTHLLRRVVDSYPDAARRVPGLRMVLVTGPRIDPSSIAAPRGVEVHGYLPDLHRRLAACDLAVVQGGLTTTMELAAARRPFVYVPLRNHFEQNVHVRHRLDNYGAGTCVRWDDATPDHLAETIATELGRAVDHRPVEADGAARVAALLAELV